MRVRIALAVIVILLAAFAPPHKAYAVSTWNPTLLVNTESFQQIDSGDGTSTVDLQFGSSTSTLKLLTSGIFQFNKSLSVLGGISGSYLTIDHQANISGALLVKGNITGRGTISGTTINANSLLTGSTLQGFGLYNCQGSANKLTYNATTKKFLCEADQTGVGGGSNWSSTGSLQNAFDLRFVNQHGDTMTGALTISTSTTQSATGALNILQTTHATGAYIKSTSNKEPALAIDIVGTPNAPHLLFGYQGVFDTNLYRGSANLLKTSGSFFALGTISGSVLRVSNGADIHGPLSVSGAIRTEASVSGAYLTFMGATSSYILGNLGIGKSGTPNTKLEVVGTVSGTTLNANWLLTGSLIQGFGLYDCQGTANKLTYNATTKRFQCEADQTGGGPGGSNWSNTGSLSAAFDLRYVNQHGDTMTGALTIQNGNSPTATATPLLNVRGAISGALLRASNMTVSGAVVYSSGNTLKQSAKGLSGQLLLSQGTSAPKWADPVGGMMWYFDGTQVVATAKGPQITMPMALTLSGVTLKAKGAPTGAALIYNIKKDGTTIFSTRPQINAGATTGGTNAVFSITNIGTNSVLTIDIDQVGSTFAGSGVTVMLKGTRRY